MTYRSIIALVVVLVAIAPLHPAMGQQQLSAQQQDYTKDFAYFMQAYEARFGAMPPDLKQNMITTASNEIAAGNYPAFIAGLRQAIGVETNFGERPDGAAAGARPQPAQPAQPSGPGAGAAGAISGMRVFYVQRSPLGYSHASGYVHFCPGGYFHEGNEATIQNPQAATAGVNAGSWRIESGQSGQVVGIYYQQGPRAGQRIEYNVQDMMNGRWTTTNWNYAVDRQAVC